MFSYNANVKDCLLKNGFVVKPMYFNKPRDGDLYKVNLAEEMRLIEENNRLFEERVKDKVPPEQSVIIVDDQKDEE